MAMNIKILKKISTFSLGAVLFFTPALAFAATNENPLINNTLATAETELAPTITIYTVNGVEEYKAKLSETFQEFLDAHSIDSKNLKDLEGNKIDTSEKIQKSAFFIQSSMDAKDEVITLKFPEKKVETDKLYKGTERVKTEGVDGKALKTTFLEFNPEDITEVNGELTETESKITIIKPPVEKVIEVGTKERPAPVVETPSYTYTEEDTETTAYPAPPANPKGNSIVETALKYVGYPYVWAANGPNAFDCSGLVQYVFGLHGISLPRVSGDQGRFGTRVSAAEAKPGDLVVWGDSHVAIYMGNGQIVHAANPGVGVVVGSLYGNYYFSRIS